MPLNGVLPAGIATLYACAVLLLVLAAQQLLRRRATGRRLALFTGMEASADAEGDSSWAALIARIRRALAAAPPIVRPSLIVLALIATMLAVTEGSVLWLLPALGAVPVLYEMGAGARRRKLLERQAPGVLELMSAGLRAGYSVPQALALTARESEDPTASEFALASRELDLGRGLDEALNGIALRTGGTDYGLVAAVVSIQYQFGGNLADVLDQIAETLRERFELREQLEAATAQQRTSSTLLTFLPLAILFLLFFLDRPLVEPLFTTLAGRILLALTLGMILMGWIAMRAVVRTSQ